MSVEFTNSVRETVLLAKAITSIVLLHANPAGGMVWLKEPVVPFESVLHRLVKSGGVRGLTVSR